MQLEQGFVYPERRRRGRKRKAEKMAELAMAEALAKREQARILASLDAGVFFYSRIFTDITSTESTDTCMCAVTSINNL